MNTAGDPGPELLLTYLLTWLGASSLAFVLAAWGLYDAVVDTHAANSRRLRRQARTNLFLAGTFFLQACGYLALGVLIVLGPAHITLTGPASVVVVTPSLFVVAQVVALRLNRAAAQGRGL